MPNMKNNIRSERLRLGYSQEGLGNELGVNVETIRSWEDGSTQIRVSQLIAMADMFSCSIDYLLARTSDRSTYDPIPA